MAAFTVSQNANNGDDLRHFLRHVLFDVFLSHLYGKDLDLVI